MVVVTLPLRLVYLVTPRSLQQFLPRYVWGAGLAPKRLLEMVRKQHAGPHQVAIIDETSDVKKGDRTPGVTRVTESPPNPTPNDVKRHGGEGKRKGAL